MPLPFEDFQGKGVLDFSSASSSSSSSSHFCSESLLIDLRHSRKLQHHDHKPARFDDEGLVGLCYASEPTSVLDAVRSPSPLTSSSTTLSSSHGGSAGGADVASAISGDNKKDSNNNGTSNNNSNYNLSVEEKCPQMGVEDWDSDLPGSPCHEQSILRLVMGDVEDPSIGLNKILQSTGGFQSQNDLDFNAPGFGVLDPSFGLESVPVTADPLGSSGYSGDVQSTSAVFSTVSLPQPVFQDHNLDAAVEEKPQIFNPQVVINQSQAHFSQNPSMFMPLTYGPLQEHHHSLSPPPPKRANTGSVGLGPDFRVPFPDTGPELLLRRSHHHYHQIQHAIAEQLFKAAELIGTGGDSVLSQSILARLNHHLSSPIGKPPFHRAAFYFKEALQKLLHAASVDSPSQSLPSYNLIFKIGAHKSFSEISPILQFANFTSNQALLEVFEGFGRVHIVDFDLGYGGQWASLMQELVLRPGGPPALKVTAFASPLMQDELELGFTGENLKHFAAGLNIPLEIEILSLGILESATWPLSLFSPEKEAVAVNVSVNSFSNYLPLILRFVKQISPKILVSIERASERADAPFAHSVVQALHSHACLLESLDAAVNTNLDAVQKIERFLIHPGIEKLVANRHRWIEASLPWRALFLQCGFSPVTLSNFTESQAECLVQRTPVRGFQVEKKHSSLVLSWQKKDLVSVSAWRC